MSRLTADFASCFVAAYAPGVFLDVNGVRLHAIDVGRGARTLLAVGGWTGSWEVWEEPIGYLTRAGWRCIAYDHRGAGESPVAPASISVRAMIDDVAGVLDALGVARCVLAGESQGGAVAQYAAARWPERFDGLVLSAAAPTGGRPSGGPFADLCRTDYPAAVAGFVERCFPEPDVEHLKRWGRDILLRADGAQAARIIEMWGDDDVPALDGGTIAAPTLILHGDGDAIVPIAVSHALVEQMPDAELVVYEGVGHVPTMTRPREVADAILRRFG